MQLACDVCGDAFEAKRISARYCSERCKKRAQRTPGGVTTLTQPTAPSTPDAPAGTVEAATVATLTKAERADTPLGQAAVALARRLDDPGRDTGSGLAALARQLQATLEAATADVRSAASPLDKARDELAERRARSA